VLIEQVLEEQASNGRPKIIILRICVLDHHLPGNLWVTRPNDLTQQDLGLPATRVIGVSNKQPKNWNVLLKWLTLSNLFLHECDG